MPRAIVNLHVLGFSSEIKFPSAAEHLHLPRLETTVSTAKSEASAFRKATDLAKTSASKLHEAFATADAILEPVSKVRIHLKRQCIVQQLTWPFLRHQIMPIAEASYKIIVLVWKVSRSQ